MKTPYLVIALLAAPLAWAQTTVTSSQNTGGATALPAPTAFTIVSNDFNSRIWERTVYSLGSDGTAVPRKSRYTELCSGLNFRDPTTGQWRLSREQIDLLPPGGAFAAQAANGQHQARFPLDIAQGVIQLTGPDGTQMISRPIGLFFEDDSNSVLIAVLTNSIGGLVGSNEVVYPNAFEGAAAAVRYKYTKSGFEQDILIQGQLPDPASLGLMGHVRLGVLTAFFDTNNPVATPGAVDIADGLSDVTLTFGNGNGSLRMGQGRAFSIGNTKPSPPLANMPPAALQNWLTNAAQRVSADGSPSFKRWFQSNGRNFLMEEVPYRRVAAQLNQLPQRTSRLNPVSTNLYAATSFMESIPARLLSTAATVAPGETRTMHLAKLDLDQTRAVVLDYQTVNSGGSYLFQGDTTYLVSGACYFSGNVTFEGGTVIKYPGVNSVSQTPIGAWNATAFIELDGTVTCQTSSYHPAVFTAVDDNSVGEPIGSGYPGGYYANPAIYAPYGVSLSNVRVNYADLAFMTGDNGSLKLSDSQVNQCYLMTILGLNDGNSGPMSLTCGNCLFSGVYYSGLVWDWGGYAGDQYCLTNCTVNNFYYLMGYGYYNSSYDVGCAANSIFANDYLAGNIAWQGGYNGFYNSFNYGGGPSSDHAFTTGTSPFQTAGGGNYYLATNPDGSDASGFRGKGTTIGVSPGLLADLAAKTTHPPYLYVNTTVSGNFSVYAARDMENPGPDLGYHYDPLDYIFQNCQVNSTMTFLAGTAVGWQEGQNAGQKQGLYFSDSYLSLEFYGIASQPCYFVRCNTVQESDNSGDGTGIAGSDTVPTIAATFTRFSALGDRTVFFDSNWGGGDFIDNCEFWDGAIGANPIYALDLKCHNCLFDRSFINFWLTTSSFNCNLELRKCTMHGGNLTINNPNSGGAIFGQVYDCAFDATTLSITDPYKAIDFSCSYNAYLYRAIPLPNDHNDVFVLGGFNWKNGPLGNFYLPHNYFPNGSPAPDGTRCINAGYWSASDVSLAVVVNGATGAKAPLSDFTTQPNEQLDSGAVDIGYHYVASEFINPVAPQLTTACLSDGIALTWTYTAKPEFPIQDFKIYRKTSPDGTYDYNSPLATVSPDSRFYVDKGANFTIGQNYCYLVTFDYYDPFTDTTYPTYPPAPNAPGYSNESCRSTCSLPPPPAGGIDVVFIVDNTSSMASALLAIQTGINSVLSDIVTASGNNNYRLALITTDTDNDENNGHDMVDVRVPFTNDLTTFQNAIQDPNLMGGGGLGVPESTDECLNTAVNESAHAAAGRSNSKNCSVCSGTQSTTLQIGNFTDFRQTAAKLVVLITDATPGGFCNCFDPATDIPRALGFAQAARNQCIKINAIQVWHDGDPQNAQTVMQGYAGISCGWYEQLDGQADNVADAIRTMLYTQGACNCQ